MAGQHILATADGCGRHRAESGRPGAAEIMRRSSKSKPVVWRWQARFMAEGVEGLTRDKRRRPGKQPPPTVGQRKGFCVPAAFSRDL